MLNKAQKAIGKPLLALLILAMFVVPWFVPVTPVKSESYALGFSNRAFIAILVLAVLPLTYLISKLGFAAATPAALAAEAKAEPSKPARIFQKLFLFFGIAVPTAFLLYFLVFYRGLDFYGGEGNYFMVRTHLMESGRMPYRDFEFAYGPLQLFGIAAIHSLGTSHGLALWVMLVLQIPVGLFAVYYIAKHVLPNKPFERNFVCAGLFASMALCVTCFGLNYIYFRFAVPLVLPVFLFHWWETRKAAWSFWLAPLVFLVGWTISPEIGIVSSIASFGVSFLLTKRKVLFTAYYLTVLGTMVRLFPAIRESTFTILEHSSGGNLFPIVPAPHILLFIASALLATIYIARQSVKNRPVDWFLYLYSVGTLPASLGRCDPGHVFFYGLGFIILASKSLMGYQTEGWRREIHLKYIVAYTALCILGLSVLNWNVFRFYIKNLPAKALTESQIEAIAAKLPEGPLKKTALNQRTKLPPQQPFEIKQEGKVTILEPAVRTKGLEYARTSYYPTLQNACTLKAYEKIAADVQGSERIYMSRSIKSSLSEEYTPPYGLMNNLFLFPMSWFSQRNDPSEVVQPLKAVMASFRIENEDAILGFDTYVPAGR